MKTWLHPLQHRAPAGNDPPVPVSRPAPPPRRRRWSTWLLPAALGAGIAGLLVSNHYETASLGQRIDHTVARSEQAARDLADGLQRSAQEAAESGAVGVGRAATVVSDAGITASIKTALAADPALSVLKIDVSTREGVVTLTGPAPSAEARDRASVLARAPAGVRDVRNDLVLPNGP